MAEYLCLPRIEASWAVEAGLTTLVDGTHPCITVIVMEWTWAFWLVQRARLNLFRRAKVPLDRTALGGWPFPNTRLGAIAVPYCDNVTIVGTSAPAVRELCDRVLGELEPAGFSMHEISPVEHETSVLGCDLGGWIPRSRRKGMRAWLLEKSLDWLVAGPRVTGRRVEVLIGHFVSAALYNRVGLSVMRSLYTFVQDQYLTAVPLWKSCRYEVWVMSGIVMMLSSDLSRPWSPRVMAAGALMEPPVRTSAALEGSGPAASSERSGRGLASDTTSTARTSRSGIERMWALCPGPAPSWRSRSWRGWTSC